MVPLPRPSGQGWVHHPSSSSDLVEESEAMSLIGTEPKRLFDLPDEVLTRVGEFVFQEAKNDWAAINKLTTLSPLLVSHKFTSIYLPVLYTHPHLTYRTLPLFRTTILTNPSIVSHLKHLTVRLSPCGEDDTSSPEPQRSGGLGVLPDRYTWDRERNGMRGRGGYGIGSATEEQGQERLLELVRTLSEFAGEEVADLGEEEDLPPSPPPPPNTGPQAWPDDGDEDGDGGEDDDEDTDSGDEDEESDESDTAIDNAPDLPVGDEDPSMTNAHAHVESDGGDDDDDDDALISRWGFRSGTAPGSSFSDFRNGHSASEVAEEVRSRWMRRSERLRALRAEVIASQNAPGAGSSRDYRSRLTPGRRGGRGTGTFNNRNGSFSGPSSSSHNPNNRNIVTDPPHHVLPKRRIRIQTLWIEDATIDTFKTIMTFCTALNYFQPLKARVDFRIVASRRGDQPYHGEGQDFVSNMRESVVRIVKGWAQEKRLLALSFCPLNYSAADVFIDRRVELFKRLACRHIRIVVPPDVRSLKFFAGDREAWLHLDDSPIRRLRALPQWQQAGQIGNQWLNQLHQNAGANAAPPNSLMGHLAAQPQGFIPSTHTSPATIQGTQDTTQSQTTLLTAPAPPGTGLGLTTNPGSTTAAAASTSTNAPFTNVARAAAAIYAAAAAVAAGKSADDILEPAPPPVKRGWTHMSGESEIASQDDAMNDTTSTNGGASTFELGSTATGKSARSESGEPAPKKIDKGKGKAVDQDGDDAKMNSPTRPTEPIMETYGTMNGKVDYKGKGKVPIETLQPAVDVVAHLPVNNAAQSFILEGQILPADSPGAVSLGCEIPQRVPQVNAEMVSSSPTNPADAALSLSSVGSLEDHQQRRARTVSFGAPTVHEEARYRPARLPRNVRATPIAIDGYAQVSPRPSALSFPGFGLISHTAPLPSAIGTGPPYISAAAPGGQPHVNTLQTSAPGFPAAAPTYAFNNAAMPVIQPPPAVLPVPVQPVAVAPTQSRFFPPPGQHPDELLHADTLLFELEIDRADFEDYRWFEFGSDLPSQLCRIRTGTSPWINVPIDSDAFEEYTYRSNLGGSEPADSIRQSPYVPPDSPEFDFGASDEEGDFDEYENDEDMEG